MAGIYVHIPFCKSRCIYCGFFSTVLLGLRSQYVDAVCKEISIQKNYLDTDNIQTIYFGGGTPSQLQLEKIEQILDKIYNTFTILKEPEITIEINPDDITEHYTEGLRKLPINRISLGIQTFKDQTLHFTNRRHTSQKAIEAVKMLQENGFTNISIDMMFGFPNQTMEEWEKDINQALLLKIQHISAYSLMYEEGTKLYNLLHNNKIQEIDENLSLAMYQTLMTRLKEAGFDHYEISNFSLPGYYSRHNSSYWDSSTYLGIGAGAHSFNGTLRKWNVNDIRIYIDGINNNKTISEYETLTTEQKFNEMVMTRLRTANGLNLNIIQNIFGDSFYNHLTNAAKPYYNNGLLQEEKNIMKLTNKGIYVSNDIISSLFI